MAKKADEGFLERARREFVRRYSLNPAADDIAKTLKAIGGQPAFAAMSEENKTRLFLGMLKKRRQAEIFEDLIRFGTEEPEPMRAALESFNNQTERNLGHLAAVARIRAVRRGIPPGEPALMDMNRFLDEAREVAEISREVSRQPRPRDERHTRSRRTQAETEGILELLQEVGIVVPKTESDDGLKLAAAMVTYIRGRDRGILPKTFVRRLQRMEAARRRQFKKKFP
jgi:hypothetical protein